MSDTFIQRSAADVRLVNQYVLINKGKVSYLSYAFQKTWTQISATHSYMYQQTEYP